jgi:chromatin remodeling complex protein RSC6
MSNNTKVSSPAPAPAPAPTATATETFVDESTKITSQFSEVLTMLSGFRQQITMLQNHIRGLERNVRKQIKVLHREAKKNRNKGNRKPSGFAVPTLISKELCDFMKRPHGSEVARTEVTQYIIKYIKEHDLQFPENRKVIKPDKSLKNLLAVPKKEEVTYFNLQRYMNRHFVKKSA